MNAREKQSGFLNGSRRHTSAAFACVLALTLGMFTGCSDASEGDQPWGGAYAEEFAQALADAPNDYAREILADGLITPAEIQDAQSRTRECIVAAVPGASVGFDPDHNGTIISYPPGFHSVNPTPEELNATRSAEFECEMHWLSFGSLYYQIVSNPNNEDWDSLVADCLVRHEIVASPFTGTDLKRIQDEYQEQYLPQITRDEEAGTITYHYPDGTSNTSTISSFQVGDQIIESLSSDFGVTWTLPPMVFPGGATDDAPGVRQCQSTPLR